MSSAEVAANKALFKRFHDAANTGDIELLANAIDELVAPDAVVRTPLPIDVTGAEALKQIWAMLFSVYPDIHVTVEDLIAEGDKVVARYTVRAATQEEEGIPSQKVEITGMTLFRIADGRIREVWIINDQMELYRQLGFTIQPPESSKP